MAQEINFVHSRWLPQHGPSTYTNFGIKVAPHPYNGGQAAAFAAAPIAVGGAGGGGRFPRAASTAGEEQRRQVDTQNRAVGQLLRTDRHQQKSGH